MTVYLLIKCKLLFDARFIHFLIFLKSLSNIPEVTSRNVLVSIKYGHMRFKITPESDHVNTCAVSGGS